MQKFIGQGATEYLVLLAVVLVIALVGIALLGFFPGTASDAQEQESKIYWQSASPVSVTAAVAKLYVGTNATNRVYIRIRNSGNYPIRITKILAESNYADQFQDTTSGWVARQISDYAYLSPGEETDFGYYGFGSTTGKYIGIMGKGYSAGSGYIANAASPSCQATVPYGKMVANNFGFEYIQYVEGQQITKREIGKAPMVAPCTDPA